ncbi:MAG: glycosyltransferase [Desulfobacteraceae bacterium]|nr:glycosyltransferase [Desulfobacteraceae bacterium]
MILKGYPRISETFISNEIYLLEQHGFKIHIFSMRKPRESFAHNSISRIKAPVDYLPETIMNHLPRLLYYNLRMAFAAPRTYREAMKTAFRRFKRTRKSATLKHLLQAGYLVQRFFPKASPSHLHAHFAHSPASVAMFAAKLSGLPFSFTAHAKDIYTSDKRQLTEKIGLASFVVTCTQYNRDYLSSLAPGHRTPIFRNYHGIDLSLFANHQPRALPREPYHLLTVARMTEKKGLPNVLTAVAELKRRGLNLRYTLIGDGDDRRMILAKIQELGLGEIVQCTGTLPHHEVLSYYQSVDVFVLGCKVAADGDRDGIPNVLVESMAMGVPVVATRVSAIPELVAHNRTGLLVDQEQPQALADAIERLLTDAELYRQVISAAKEKVESEFDNGLLIRDLVDIYHRYTA